MFKIPVKLEDIRLLSFSNGEWANAEQTIVRGMLQWNTMQDVQLGAVDLTEDYQHIQNLKQRIEAGEFGEIAAYTPPSDEEVAEDAAFRVRKERDYILKEQVDPIVSNPLRWADMTTEEQNAWSAYRTALLDITDQAGFPHNVTWPTKP